MSAVVDPRLSDGEVRTLAYVVGRIFDDSFSLSITEIASDLGLSWRAAQRHLAHLRDLGFLAAKQRSTPRGSAKGAALIWRRGPLTRESGPPDTAVRGPLTRESGPPDTAVRGPLTRLSGISRSGSEELTDQDQIARAHAGGEVAPPPPLDELLDAVAGVDRDVTPGNVIPAASSKRPAARRRRSA
jgi:DNA-binding transcriptional ArsR family regulator